MLFNYKIWLHDFPHLIFQSTYFDFRLFIRETYILKQTNLKYE